MLPSFIEDPELHELESEGSSDMRDIALTLRARLATEREDVDEPFAFGVDVTRIEEDSFEPTFGEVDDARRLSDGRVISSPALPGQDGTVKVTATCGFRLFGTCVWL